MGKFKQTFLANSMFFRQLMSCELYLNISLFHSYTHPIFIIINIHWFQTNFNYSFVTSQLKFYCFTFIVSINNLELKISINLSTYLSLYTEELYKKDLNNPDNHYGVITHLEPDILECQVKWALGSITTNKDSGVMEFQRSYVKS